MDDLDMAMINNRRLEKELKAAKLALWDQFFLAAMGATLHHGKVAGVEAAAEIADQAMWIRESKRSDSQLPTGCTTDQVIRDLRGVIGVMAELLSLSAEAIRMLEGESEEERFLLRRLLERCDAAVKHVRAKQVAEMVKPANEVVA